MIFAGKQDPFRARILSKEELVQQALQLTENQAIRASTDTGKLLFKRFEENCQLIEDAYFVLADHAAARNQMPPGAEWLLDNYHVLEQHTRDIRRHFPKRYYQSLPKLSDGEFIGLPRVYELAVVFLTHTDSVLRKDLLSSFIEAYQSKSQLTIGELWAIPIMLRLVLVENLRRLVSATLNAQRVGDIALEIFERIFSTEEISGTQRVLLLADAVLQEARDQELLTLTLLRRMRAGGLHSSMALEWLEETLREAGHDPGEQDRQDAQTQAANQISTGNTITSLKLVGTINWQKWFEQQSPVDRTLAMGDPLTNYGKTDFRTRNRCRTVIEGLARTSKYSELEVAERCVRMAQHAQQLAPDACTPEHRKRLLVEYYLLSDGLRDLQDELGIQRGLQERVAQFAAQRVFLLYSLSILLVSLSLISFLLADASHSGASFFELACLFIFFLIPSSAIASDLVQWSATHLFKPSSLARLDFSQGIPADCKALVVVHCIFSQKEAIRRAVHDLEVRFLGNDDMHLSYALLADLHDAAQASLESDKELMALAQQLIAELNQTHAHDDKPRFFVIFRERVWHASESKYLGWERKRGKISELNQLLLGSETTTFLISDQEKQIFRSARYVITLDADTQLPRGAAAELLGCIAHPLNHPVFSADSGIVVDGYAVIQPRASVSLVSANNTYFAGIFCGNAGLDPYTQTVSDVYQDLFHEGSYIGKGVYDPVAFEKALHERVPEQSLLSHDLFEGLFARVALASDIELPDDFPSRYNTFARRSHRWVRGDWQILPWAFARIPDVKRQCYRNPLSALSRWKLIDNLRRSLLAPSTCLLLLFLWTFCSLPALYTTLIVFIIIAFPVFTNLANAFMTSPRDIALGGYVRGVGQDLLRQIQQSILIVTFLPYQAYLMCHAIAVTLYRVYFSRKNLLEWITAYSAEKRLSQDLTGYLLDMAPASFFALCIAVLVSQVNPDNLAVAGPIILLWFLSGAIAWAISRQRPPRSALSSEEDREYLRTIAADTWSYFDELISAERNYLVPDNLQLVPVSAVAERTSPTNIGLSILSLIAAYDLGFITLPALLNRSELTFSTLLKLERFHGHFFNWYDIRSLAPLNPRYISFVDSGNLCGHLICASEAYREFSHASFVKADFWENLFRQFQRLKSSLEILDREFSANLEQCCMKLRALDISFKGLAQAALILETCKILQEGNSGYEKLPEGFAKNQLRNLFSKLKQASELRSFVRWLDPFESLYQHIQDREHAATEQRRAELLRNFDRLAKIVSTRKATPSLLFIIRKSILQLLQTVSENTLLDKDNPEVSTLVSSLRSGLELSVQTQESLLTQIESLQESSLSIASEMDFSFLYNEEKQLFVIGYDVGSAHRDESHYDLLASEARLGSFVAIALGQIPQKHWFSLSRSLTDSSGGKALLSWSGTMFEYLMPALVMKHYPGTLLAESCDAIVRAQRFYARKRRVPWGISESGYSGVDFHKTYQYRAFGVPGLGLKRGLSDDLVISPYSSLLAVSIDPRETMRNLHRLESYGARGRYGFYEAIDYTHERLSAEEEYHLVQSFLAHHQGMTIVSLANFLKANVFQERFHRNAHIESANLLLQERFPHSVPAIIPHQAELTRLERQEEGLRVPKGEILRTAHTAVPRTRLLANQNLSLMIDNAGSGYLKTEQDIMLTRWKEDALINNRGTYIYARDLETADLWSATYQPTLREPDTYEVIFNPDKVEFRRRDAELMLHTELTISPEDMVEVRRVTLTNFSNRKRRIELTSYAEVAMASTRAFEAHPTFSKMFIESEYLSDLDMLLFSRRPRSSKENRIFLFHQLSMKVCWSKTEYETDRLAFIGRGRDVSNPIVFDEMKELAGGIGPVLDPILSLRTILEIPAGSSESVNFVTGFADNRERILELANRYHDHHATNRAFEMSWSQSNVELRNEHISIKQTHTFQHLGNALLFNHPRLRGPQASLVANRLDQSGLWRFGISGDFPILLLRINAPQQMKLVIELLKAHNYLRERGLRYDLVILNEYPGGYLQSFQEELEDTIRHMVPHSLIEQNTGIFLRTPAQLSREDQLLLETVARVVLSGSRGSLEQQVSLEESTYIPLHASSKRSRSRESKQPSAGRLNELEFFNGFGGFENDGRSYTIKIDNAQMPPLPWSNVIANPEFGCLVTESGAGYTWSQNSRENRLSPWSNDAVSDPLGEVVYLRDKKSGDFWCPTPAPISSAGTFLVSHQPGRTQFESQNFNIQSKLSIWVAPDQPIKYFELELRNLDSQPRELDLYFYIDWVLGIQRDQSYRTLSTWFDTDAQTLCAVNHYNNEFKGRIVFIGSSHKLKDYTCDRSEFLGRNRNLSMPRILAEGQQHLLERSILSPIRQGELSATIGAGFESCGVVHLELKLKADESTTLRFFLGEAETIDAMHRIVSDLRSEKVATAAPVFWDKVCNSCQIKTPERSFDILMNSWLLYQTLSCRIFGRSAFYQSGGAFGFRDQLQDSLACLYSDPSITRQQILLHASRQFLEGDVQHWWHPPTGRGVRTLISDDYLWLPYVLAKYLEFTEDRSILEERVAFIEAEPLQKGHAEAYIVPQISGHKASIYEHAVICIDRALQVGDHGLPLIGGGDWNDGMNEVGIEGKGESVWLAWFLCSVLDSFRPLVLARKDNYRAEQYARAADSLSAAIEKHAWDGNWYLRGFFDDGTPLGSQSNDECQIDSLSQSWNLISGRGQTDRALKAFDMVCEKLVDREQRLIRLLAPAFDRGSLNPGYIKGYLPGVRENGGQYTHAAAWVVMASTLLGRGNQAFDLFQIINPITHGSSMEGIRQYMAEPFVTCGDVYALPPHAGRAGWSWYTGSAAWLYRVGLENILGLKRRGKKLYISPCIPAHWPEYSVILRMQQQELKINVKNPEALETGRLEIACNGTLLSEDHINLEIHNAEQLEIFATLRRPGL